MVWKVAAALLAISMVAMDARPASAACSGNELNGVIRNCARVVVSGGSPALGSPCCTTIRTVNFPCLCSQLANSPYAGTINPSTANSIKSSCRVQTPKGLRCAGFSA